MFEDQVARKGRERKHLQEMSELSMQKCAKIGQIVAPQKVNFSQKYATVSQLIL